MKIKTTNDIWDDWRKYYLKSKPIRKKYIDKKWVTVDDLIKVINQYEVEGYIHKDKILNSLSNENKKEGDKNG